MRVPRPVFATLLVLVAAGPLRPDVGAPRDPGTTEVRSPSIAAYRGPGMWVDIYDTKALTDPVGAARTMAAHGIRTLYLETGNYRRVRPVVHSKVDATLIEAAHAVGMRVVLWYLPLFQDVDTDFRRVMRSVEFETPNGERADSFALDIEAAEVSPEQRVANLLELSARIRDSVGPDYPLGAIIPSPRGMRRVPTYWPGFPFRDLPDTYDVILPMSYYTFHYEGADAAHRYITDNVRIIRKRTGRPDVPIHAIGGLTADTSPAEAAAVVRAAREQGILGVSLYEYGDMTGAQWRALEEMPVNAATRVASPVPLPAAGGYGFRPGGDRSHPKEVFFQAPATAGPLLLRFGVFDAQPGEVRIVVNWRVVTEVWRGPKGAWSGVRHRLIPASFLRAHRPNMIAFVAAGDFPSWSRWAVRSVSATTA